MKVLHVIPGVSKESGGPSHAIFPMCQALRDMGIKILLATTDAGIDAASAVAEVKDYEGIPVIFFRSQLGRSFKYSRPFWRWLDDNVCHYDLVHIHAVFNHCCIAAARACRQQKVPYIVRALGTLDPWSMSQKPLRKKLFWYWGIQKMLRSAAAIHYTSVAEKKAVEESLKLNHGWVVPLGVDTKLAENGNELAGFANLFPTLVEHSYILVLSRLLPTKGLEVLVDAFLPLVRQREFENWRLVLAGEGDTEYVAKLKRMVAAANGSEQVLFPGWLQGKSKDEALGNASLLALPSYHENFGLCVMEASSRGVPVLISPHVNLAPEVEAAEAGWVVSVDRLGLQAGLTAALGSKAERLRRGQAGRRLAREFQWPVIATKLDDLYTSVLSRRNL
jgi:glycosyltransferase involved in cell wall biosynthesis